MKGIGYDSSLAYEWNHVEFWTGITRYNEAHFISSGTLLTIDDTDADFGNYVIGQFVDVDDRPLVLRNTDAEFVANNDVKCLCVHSLTTLTQNG